MSGILSGLSSGSNECDEAVANVIPFIEEAPRQYRQLSTPHSDSRATHRIWR